MLLVEGTYVLAEPLSHPRILFDDVWRRDGAVYTASTELDGFEAANAADGLTWDFWRPTAMPANVEVQLLASEPVDSAMLAGHNLGTNDCSAKPQYWNGSSWVDLAAAQSPTTDHILAWLFGSVTASRFRFLFENANSPALTPSIGVAMMGTALALPHGPTLDDAPITLQTRTVVRPNISEGGQFLGRSIRREGIASTIKFEHFETTFIRSTMLDFFEAARTAPFGWMSNPDESPEDVALLWTPAGSEITPVHSGYPHLMNIEMAVEGILS